MDFRSTTRRKMCDKFRNKGYVIEKGGKVEIDQIREIIKAAKKVEESEYKRDIEELEKVHHIMDRRRSNELRLQVMGAVNKDNNINLLYYQGYLRYDKYYAEMS